MSILYHPTASSLSPVPDALAVGDMRTALDDSLQARHDCAMSLWAKDGDHQRWVASAIARNAREHGGKVAGDPTCVLRTFAKGIHTVLGADGSWWLEFMSVHGKDWNGPVEDDGRELEDLISSSR